MAIIHRIEIGRDNRTVIYDDLLCGSIFRLPFESILMMKVEAPNGSFHAIRLDTGRAANFPTRTKVLMVPTGTQITTTVNDAMFEDKDRT